MTRIVIGIIVFVAVLAEIVETRRAVAPDPGEVAMERIKAMVAEVKSRPTVEHCVEGTAHPGSCFDLATECFEGKDRPADHAGALRIFETLCNPDSHPVACIKQAQVLLEGAPAQRNRERGLALLGRLCTDKKLGCSERTKYLALARK